MKLKGKLTLGGMMTAITCALVGSITGTFAWYGYSTRATTVLGGEINSKAVNLQLGLVTQEEEVNNPDYIPEGQEGYDASIPEKIMQPISIDGLAEADENLICWSPIGGGLKMSSIKSYLQKFGYAQGEMSPTTSGWTKEEINNPDYIPEGQEGYDASIPEKIEVDKDYAPLKMPKYQYNKKEAADKNNYFYLPIALRVSDLKGNYLQNEKIYVSDADITLGDTNSTLDKAFRLGFKTYNDAIADAQYKMFNPSSDVDGNTALGGLLDLNLDGYADVEQVDYEYLVRNELLYGAIKSYKYYKVQVENPNYIEGGEEPEFIDGDEDKVFEQGDTVDPTWTEDDFKTHIHDPQYHEVKTKRYESYEAYEQDWVGTDSFIAEFDEKQYLKDGEEDKFIVTTGENKIAHVDLTMWVEGWDENVNDTTLGVEFFLGLQFQIDDINR